MIQVAVSYTHLGDLNKRRGQVEGMESSRSGARIVKACLLYTS